MAKRQSCLFEGSEWTFEKIEAVDKEIARIAEDKYKLDTYPNQIEIISSDQMLSAYASVGMPIFYEHWSFGKHYVEQQRHYKRGLMGLAYELVINSDPCIAYLMEENTMTMQTLVIAHACYGHNSFFKNNYLFKQWTDAESIIDYLLFARNYIRKCEEKYGYDAVEEILDSCHALQLYGIDRYKKPRKLSIAEEKERQEEREQVREEQVNVIWQSTVPKKPKKKKGDEIFPAETQENILHFIEEHSPVLESWQRELIRIVRNVSQYFYPQRQTKVVNEGWATFTHYNIMNDLFDDGLITPGSVFEFLQSHTNVIAQPDWDDPRFNGINPYTLGFNMMMDIKRICEEPTEEDKKWFPDIAGDDDPLSILHFAVENFKDESFIMQFLSPHMIRKMRLFSVIDNPKNPYNYVVDAIHDDIGYRNVRESISQHYNLNYIMPDIQVYRVDKEGDRTLYLKHYMCNNIPLEDKSANEVLRHIFRLWGYNVVLQSINSHNTIAKTYKCEKT